MTVSKSYTPSSSASAHLSVVSTHAHPHLHPHQLKSNALASASVTKTTVDTRSTMDSFPSSLNGNSTDKVSGGSSKNPSSWDPQDDILLRHLKEVKKLGWKDISQYFNNRTPNACQFRWRRLKSGNLKSNKTAHIDVTDFPASKVKADHLPASGTKPVKEEPSSEPQIVSIASRTPSVAIPIPTNINSNGNTLGKSLEPRPQSQSQIQPQNGFNSVSFQHSYSKSPYGNVNFTSNPTTAMSSGMANSNSTGAGSNFLRARSNSHSFSKPLVSSEEENIGFIPKIIVRSRRSSFAHPQVLSQPSSINNSTSNLSTALNTTLNTIKSRKNSFTSRSRRSSFNISSNTPSRRSSVVTAPNSLSGMFGMNSGSSTPKISRRDSMATAKKEFGTHRLSTPNFTDLPASSLPLHFHHRGSRTHLKQHINVSPVHGSPCNNCNTIRWSIEEDKLLSENGSRNLSIMELSILLPNRTEKEIQWRLSCLLNENSLADSQRISQSYLHSPRKSITPEDTAIDEDNCDTCDEGDNNNDDDGIDPLNQAHSPRLQNDSSPCSIISSTTTNENDSEHHASIDSSLSQADFGNGQHKRESNDNQNLKRFSTQSHPNLYIPSNSSTSLPGISTILKGTL